MTAGKEHISVDRILVSLGTVGRYQLLQGFLLSLTNITVCFNLLNFVFIAQSVKHQCENEAVHRNISDSTHGECKITTNSTNDTSSLSCDSWSYTVAKDHSIVSEWDLICDNVFFARLPQSLFIVGQAIGAVIFSNLSDKFGRKPFLIVADFLTACSGVGLAFAPNIAAFSALRLVNGICQQGVVVTAITMLLEMFPSNRRVEAATCYTLAWSVCTVLLTMTAYLLRHLTWRMLQLSFISVSITLVVHIIFMRESLRWLITNNKEEEAKQIIHKAAEMNKVDASSITLKYTDGTEHGESVNGIKPEKLELESADVQQIPNDMKYNIFDLFRDRFLLRISAVLWFTWLVDSLTYFSLYLTSSSLADDLYLNFFLNSLAEVPAGPLYWFFGRRLGRRRFFMIFHVLAGVCLLVATGVRELSGGEAASISATILAFIGKVGNATCFNGLFMFAPEIYPTNIRAAGMGAGSTAARVGGCIAPFISMLAAISAWAPGTMFGVLCLVTAAINYTFPESEGQEMPQTVDDIKAWKNKSQTPKDSSE